MCDFEGLGVGLLDGDGLGDIDGEGEGDIDGEGDGLLDGLGEGVFDFDGEGDGLLGGRIHKTFINSLGFIMKSSSSTSLQDLFTSTCCGEQ